jgi:hypothetical protein
LGGQGGFLVAIEEAEAVAAGGGVRDVVVAEQIAAVGGEAVYEGAEFTGGGVEVGGGVGRRGWKVVREGGGGEDEGAGGGSAALVEAVGGIREESSALRA